MKNRFITGAVAIAASVSILGSGIAAADTIEDNYNACIKEADTKATDEAKAAAYRECKDVRDLEKENKKLKDEQEAKEAEKKQYSNMGSFDSKTWESIYKDVKKEDKDFDSKHPYPAWLAFLKYVKILVDSIAQQLEPLMGINKVIQQLAPKA